MVVDAGDRRRRRSVDRHQSCAARGRRDRLTRCSTSTRVAALTCRALGTPERLAKGEFNETTSVSLAGMEPAFAIGIGAFGDDFSDCRAAFRRADLSGGRGGLSAGRRHQRRRLPGRAAVRSNRRPYALRARVRRRLLASDAIRARRRRASVALSRSSRRLSRLAGAADDRRRDRGGNRGLVGAALRRSPAEPPDGGGFFAHPGVRARLTFTAERAFTRSVSLAAGVVARATANRRRRAAPAHCGGRARALPCRRRSASVRFRKDSIDLGETVAAAVRARSTRWACCTCCTTIAAPPAPGRASSSAARAGSRRWRAREDA